MTQSELSQALGICVPSELWDTYVPLLKKRKVELCTVAMLDRLQTRFDLFGEYYDAVLEGYTDLENDPARKLYTDIVSLYIRDCTAAQARAIPYPQPSATPASRLMPLFVHLPSLEDAYDEMLRRGFTEEEAKNTLSIYRIYLWETEKHRGGFVGIQPPVSQWMGLFTKGEIFYPGYGGLSFQIYTLQKDDPYFLKNRKTGETLPVFGNGIAFHKSGKVILGSAGAEDPQGSFVTRFREDSTEYVGNPTRASTVSPIEEHFPKAEWELVLQPGDRVITTHIFWGSDFTPEIVDQAFSAGQRIAKACFPEYDIKALRCSSWLMNPLINSSLGEQAKLSRFSSRFIRYPKKSAGKSFFGYVFPGCSPSYEDLPENSSLQRSFKKHLLSGSSIYEYGGIMLF